MVMSLWPRFLAHTVLCHQLAYINKAFHIAKDYNMTLYLGLYLIQ